MSNNELRKTVAMHTLGCACVKTFMIAYDSMRGVASYAVEKPPIIAVLSGFPVVKVPDGNRIAFFDY